MDKGFDTPDFDELSIEQRKRLNVWVEKNFSHDALFVSGVAESVVMRGILGQLPSTPVSETVGFGGNPGLVNLRVNYVFPLAEHLWKGYPELWAKVQRFSPSHMVLKRNGFGFFESSFSGSWDVDDSYELMKKVMGVLYGGVKEDGSTKEFTDGAEFINADYVIKEKPKRE